jgi:hypothetical protein
MASGAACAVFAASAAHPKTSVSPTRLMLCMIRSPMIE